MSDVHDIALAMSNLVLEYKQAKLLTFEGSTFDVSASLLTWLDMNGMPVHVSDMRGLFKLARDVLSTADLKYLTASRELRLQMTTALTDVPPVPEHEE
jgi:hypothetical protein